MSPEFLALIVSAALGWTAYLHKKVDTTELNLERFKTIVAREYMTRAQIEAATDKLMAKLDRIEDKLDYHVIRDRGIKVPTFEGYHDHTEEGHERY
jgi:hypothetical protein